MPGDRIEHGTTNRRDEHFGGKSKCTIFRAERLAGQCRNDGSEAQGQELFLDHCRAHHDDVFSWEKQPVLQEQLPGHQTIPQIGPAVAQHFLGPGQRPLHPHGSPSQPPGSCANRGISHQTQARSAGGEFCFEDHF